MQCTATAKSTGQRCGRAARQGSRYCRYHQEGERGRPPGEVATGGEASSCSAFPYEEPRAPESAVSHGMDGEIVLLRRRIREAADEGDWEAMRRGIETLCKVLKVQYVLAGRSSESLAGSLSRVLEEVGNELGMTL